MSKKIKIISPSTSFEIAPNFNFDKSIEFFKQQGFEIELSNDWMSNQNDIDLKLEAIHEAFSDQSTDIILCSFGGFLSVNLIDRLDYDLIKQNAKPFFGFSDITVLLNAIHSKTGITTYYGPLFLSFLSQFQRKFTLEYFNKALNDSETYLLRASETIMDYDDRNESTIRPNSYWVIQEGKAEGEVVGGHIPTLSLLQGTEYFPDLSEKILLLEMNELEEGNSLTILNRLIKSLQLQKGFENLKGILIGAFHTKCNITEEKLKLALNGLFKDFQFPIVANCNFGHILPIWSIPIGGKIEIETENEIKIKVANS
ncbi:S66 peptidase family protein [Aureibacter tunicatorum]|uniref:Muramoyltetrapeptide carboxypeptidase LdcA involved in peptidoglycan recycling n=1 Tax=Aureibacter tunicatorum TaxID=866807 RepID=A0AAE3XS77_9BACT|nr:LD-carboxypeptidase [Aureibacter tunicatorum]MDR6241133.1 muramoyltetrapeptide carboxypeptidase LdcA involved in peptidoglycan recycling [Aureibacter tunicatorum]BDD03911.1 LD-carboxypeptidase [Aureibacter tunicatorum]